VVKGMCGAVAIAEAVNRACFAQGSLTCHTTCISFLVDDLISNCRGKKRLSIGQSQFSRFEIMTHRCPIGGVKFWG
jgi:hypothetical protein